MRWELAVVTLVIFVALLLNLKEKMRAKKDYDERQVLAQGTAYRVAFIGVFIWGTLLYLLEAKDTISEHFVYFSTLFVGAGLYLVVTLWRGAYFSMTSHLSNKRRLAALVLVLGLSIYQLIYDVSKQGQSFWVYVNSSGAARVFVSLMLLVIVATLSAQLLADRLGGEDH